jgi:hypothetical protein
LSPFHYSNRGVHLGEARGTAVAETASVGARVSRALDRGRLGTDAPTFNFLRLWRLFAATRLIRAG